MDAVVHSLSWRRNLDILPWDQRDVCENHSGKAREEAGSPSAFQAWTLWSGRTEVALDSHRHAAHLHAPDRANCGIVLAVHGLQFRRPVLLLRCISSRLSRGLRLLRRRGRVSFPGDCSGMLDCHGCFDHC